VPEEPRLRRATPADAAGIARVRVEGWRTTYRGIVPDAYLAAMRIEDSEAQWRRVLGAPPNRTTTMVAEEAGAVIGFASALMLPAPRFGLDAELTAIYLAADRRRMGLGRRLVGSLARAQQALGATGFLTWVIAQNRGARTFCETLGAELLVEQPFEWDGLHLVEAGYGWRDLPALIAAAAVAKTDIP
jgi:GNAT superfamily N-acetyltransferase